MKILHALSIPMLITLGLHITNLMMGGEYAFRKQQQPSIHTSQQDEQIIYLNMGYKEGQVYNPRYMTLNRNPRTRVRELNKRLASISHDVSFGKQTMLLEGERGNEINFAESIAGEINEHRGNQPHYGFGRISADSLECNPTNREQEETLIETVQSTVLGNGPMVLLIDHVDHKTNMMALNMIIDRLKHQSDVLLMVSTTGNDTLTSCMKAHFQQKIALDHISIDMVHQAVIDTFGNRIAPQVNWPYQTWQWKMNHYLLRDPQTRFSYDDAKCLLYALDYKSNGSKQLLQEHIDAAWQLLITKKELAIIHPVKPKQAYWQYIQQKMPSRQTCLAMLYAASVVILAAYLNNQIHQNNDKKVQQLSRQQVVHHYHHTEDLFFPQLSLCTHVPQSSSHQNNARPNQSTLTTDDILFLSSLIVGGIATAALIVTLLKYLKKSEAQKTVPRNQSKRVVQRVNHNNSQHTNPFEVI